MKSINYHDNTTNIEKLYLEVQYYHYSLRKDVKYGMSLVMSLIIIKIPELIKNSRIKVGTLFIFFYLLYFTLF